MKRTWADFEGTYEALATRVLTPENVTTWLHDWSELEKDLQEYVTGLRRSSDEDTRNEAAKDALESFFRDVMPSAEIAGQRLKERLLGLEGYEPEPEHREFIRRFRNEADLFIEANAPLLAEEQALGNEYNVLMGSITVELDGQKMTLPEAEKRLLEPDRALRERAWRAIHEARSSVADDLDALFIKLLSLRRRIAHNAGLPDFRAFAWRRWNRFDYTPEDGLTFQASVESEVVPLMSELNGERQRNLGVASLRPWDLSVDPEARPPLKPFEAVQELEDGTERIFERLDPDLAGQFRLMRQGWLELENREGKVPGLGYQADFPKSKRPYIYMSATGTHSDVNTLLHEAGHAFHSLASMTNNNLVWNVFSGVEFAEVASQTMEVLTLPYLNRAEGGFYDEADSARAKHEQLERILFLFPTIAQADAFQHWLYTEAPEDVSAADLDAKWSELGARFFPDIDWDELEDSRGKGWHFFHIFAVPFYIIEYSLAWLGAIQIWRNSMDNPKEALTKYRAALAFGGTKSLPELFETAGATFAFDRETVGELLRFTYAQR